MNGYTLILKPSGIWAVRWTIKGYPRHQETTGEHVKGRAQAIAAKKYEEALLRASGREPMATVNKVRARWLLAHASTVSAGHWRNVNDWPAEGLGNILLDKATSEMVMLVREQLVKARGWRPATANGWLRTLNLLGGFAVDTLKMLPAMPWSVDMLPDPKRKKPTLPLESTKAFLDAVDQAARNPQVKTAVRLMHGLGIRASEAMRSRWEWLDLDRAEYTPGDTKGGEAVPVPIPRWLVAWLLELRGENPRLGLILPDKEGNPHPPAFCRASIKAANIALSIKGVSAHRLRGTWITELLRAGTPPEEVQHMARHKRLETTMGYYQESQDVRREAQEELARKQGLA